MVRKSFRVISGVKVKTNLGERKSKGNEVKFPHESPTKIKNCLNCEKPIEECKGNCYGRL